MALNPHALQVQVSLSATCLAPFLATPAVQLGYSVPGTGQVLSRSLDLPLVATKFCAPPPVEVPAPVFAQRWQQVAGPPFKLTERLGGAAPAKAAAEALLPALGFRVLPAMDGGSGDALSAVCVFQCGGAGGTQLRQVPCMVKLEGLGTPAASLAVATADATGTNAIKQALKLVVT